MSFRAPSRRLDRVRAPDTVRDSLILAVIVVALTVCSVAADSEAGAEGGDCEASQQHE